MEHLQERQIIEHLWDNVNLTTAEQEHLSLCAQCQGHFRTLARMHDEFEVARRSQLPPETEARYVAILAQAAHTMEPESALHNLISTLAEWVRALPLWDSREQAALAGVRNANPASYRLLFGTDETEVELMVEPANGALRVVGEVMSVGSDDKNGIALVELNATDSFIALETESDQHGRFHLERVPPGTYVMTITPRYSKVIGIDPLGLT